MGEPAPVRQCLTRAQAVRLAAFALVGGGLASLILPGCGSKRAPFAYDGPTVVPGKVTLASTIHYPPFIVESAGSTPEGLGVDVCDSVGADLGLAVASILCETRDDVFQTLREKKADLGGIIAASSERSSISDDFVLSSDIMPCNFCIVAKDGVQYSSVEELDQPGAVIEACDHPTVRGFVEAVFKEAKVEFVQDTNKALTAVRNGQTPFCIMDEPEALYYLNTIFTNLGVALTFQSGANYVFVALAENEELLRDVDESVTSMKDSGMIESYETRWLGQPLRS